MLISPQHKIEGNSLTTFPSIHYLHVLFLAMFFSSRYVLVFQVRNAGPSLIPNTQIVVYWPLNGSLTNSSYYLYPAIISVSQDDFFPATQDILLV